MDKINNAIKGREIANNQNHKDQQHALLCNTATNIAKHMSFTCIRITYQCHNITCANVI